MYTRTIKHSGLWFDSTQAEYVSMRGNMVSKGKIYTHLLEPDENGIHTGLVHVEMYNLTPSFSIASGFEHKEEAEAWLKQMDELLDGTRIEVDR